MFQRKKIIIPGSGEKEILNVGGCSVVIESIPTYTSVQEVPSLLFDDQNNSIQPIYPQSKYTTSNGFDRLVILGTDESENDELYILISDEPLEAEINVITEQLRKSKIGESALLTSDDSVKIIPTFSLVDPVTGNMPSKIRITCRDNDILYSLGSDPSPSGVGTLLVADRDMIELEGLGAITSFKFVNAVTASNSRLTLHIEY